MRRIFPPVPHPRPNDWIYDLESYPNFFSASFKHSATGQRYFFEISEWVDDRQSFYNFLMSMKMYPEVNHVGYNNCGFDYPMIHLFINSNGMANCNDMYGKCQAIIKDFTGYGHTVWDKDMHIPQIDLMKIHHFDNQAKATSLKVLEINMRSQNVRDLPFPPGTVLTYEQAQVVRSYNDHDVDETEQFYYESLPLIDFREELSTKYGKNFTNFNDTKIGAEIFTIKLHQAGVKTKDGSVKRQTFRSSIPVNDIIFPYVRFETPEFNRILDFFRTQIIDPQQTKGFFSSKNPDVATYIQQFEQDFGVTIGKKSDGSKPLCVVLNGFQFDFGSGGIHGSLHKTIVRATPTHDLVDEDVASYYPNVGIQNRLFPAHLSETFCDIYEGIYFERKSYDKKNPINGALKLALNGTYGNSNSEHSVFYDPQYTMTITINGQLMLCMLAEQLMKIPGLKMVQINTDGLTYLCPKEYRDFARSISKWWENETKLELEAVDYKAMYIRDVNSYIAETTDGKVKRIGCYAYVRAAENISTREVPWHKNHSSLVIQKAAVAALTRNENIETFIRNHTDKFDFIITTKVPRSSSLEIVKNVMWGDEVVMSNPEIIQSTSRCYASTTGGALTKVMPPTATQIKKYQEGDHYIHRKTGDYKVVNPGKKAPSGMYDLIQFPNREHPDRRIGQCVGVKMRECNDINDFSWDNLDYDFYINEARKIVNPLIEGEQRAAG